MIAVWKFNLTIGDGGDVRSIFAPKGAKFIFVGMEPYTAKGLNNEALRVWALVDPAQPLEERTLRIAGTGHPLTGNEVYIGSVVAPPFAWHVFEIKSENTPEPSVT